MPSDPVPPSLAELATTHPALIDRACAALDPGHPGVAAAVAAWSGGDALAAARAVVAYWRRASLPPLPPDGATQRPEAAADAERVMADRTPFFSAWDVVPRRADGGWEWQHDGPQGDREWGWLHNRHTNLRLLFEGWRATGEARFARRIDALLWDWVVSNPYPGQRSNTASWRGLEAFCRAVNWTRIVHALRSTDLLSDATLVAVVASLPDHADYARRFHAAANNWLTMEMNGLATIGCAWPEFREAPAWRAYAAATIAPEPTGQCYPDGTQHELTFHYHQVTEGNLAAIARILDAAGHGHLLPDDYRAGIRRMWDSTAALVDQRGFGPLNNDSDEHQVAAILREKAVGCAEPGWLHIASAGAEGPAPAGPPSRLLPWAGQLAMRSGWDAAAQWAWFDAGPWGSAHQHQDMLHLSVRHHRDLLVDSGRYHYIRDAWRTYFCGTAAHNAVLVDGAGQEPGPRLAAAPLAAGDHAITDAWDFCRGRFASGFTGLPPAITHTRCVLYLRGRCWLVVDALPLDRERAVAWHWHLHPACSPAVADGVLLTTDAGTGNVRLSPVLGPCVAPGLARGRDLPEPLGWYSPRYGDKAPTTTAVWTARASGTVVQAWIISTGLGAPPAIAAELRQDGEAIVGTVDGRRLRLPLHAGLPELG